MVYAICYFLAFIPLLIMLGCIRVKNKKQLKAKGKYILACNHMSNWDSVAILFKRCKKMKFLAKKELMDKPFKKWLLGKLGGIPIDRDKPELSSLKAVFRELKADKPVCIFPSGTRMPTPQMQYEDVKDGIALFAVKAQAPVVPAMFVKKVKPFRRNTLIIGEPISPEGYTTDKVSMDMFAKKVCDAMNKLLEDNVGSKK